MDTPATKYAHAYLSARGIQVETALGAGANIYGRGSCPHDLFLTRLGFTSWGNTQLPDLVEESLWFSCLDAKGNTQSHFCRVFPPPKDKEGRPAKFLTPKNGIGYPFIPRTTWDVADKPIHPLCLTEGPIKALAVLQAGGLPIGVGGVWMATTIDKEDRTDLHPVLA